MWMCVEFRIHTLINTDKVAWYPKAFYNYRVTNDASNTNNFNMTIMLERWMEVHKKMDAEIYRRMGRELYWDEYLNTVGYLFTNYPVTEKHLKTVQEILQYVDDEVINGCAKLENKKDIVLLVKQEKYQLGYTLPRKVNDKYNCEFYAGKRLLFIHLFIGLKHNIIRNIF